MKMRKGTGLAKGLEVGEMRGGGNANGSVCGRD